VRVHGRINAPRVALGVPGRDKLCVVSRPEFGRGHTRRRACSGVLNMDAIVAAVARPAGGCRRSSGSSSSSGDDKREHVPELARVCVPTCSFSDGARPVIHTLCLMFGRSSRELFDFFVQRTLGAKNARDPLGDACKNLRRSRRKRLTVFGGGRKNLCSLGRHGRLRAIGAAVGRVAAF
jgi:hypothetical protein